MIVFFMGRSAKWDVFTVGVIRTPQFQALVGTQSWLLCPFISLALAGAERARNVTLVLHWTSSACSLPQERFWLSQPIIDALTAHSQSLSPQSPVALELQSPDAWTGSDHLPAGLQERCVPAHIMEALHVWLTAQCEFTHFWQNQFPCFSQPICCLRTRTTVATFSLWTSLGFRSSGREQCGCPSKLRNCSASVHRRTSSWSSDSCVCTVTVH